jgi:hypothetical protein
LSGRGGGIRGERGLAAAPAKGKKVSGTFFGHCRPEKVADAFSSLAGRRLLST